VLDRETIHVCSSRDTVTNMLYLVHHRSKITVFVVKMSLTYWAPVENEVYFLFCMKIAFNMEDENLLGYCTM
jgi:hypothetical protein